MDCVYKNAKKGFILFAERKPLLKNTFFPIQSFFCFQYVRSLNF